MGWCVELLNRIVAFWFNVIVFSDGGGLSVLYLLIAVGILAGCVGVVTLQNPIHSVFALIGVFIVGTVLLITVRAEFLALMFVIVYVGAVVVFFLFVIMMVDINVGLVFNISFVGKYTTALFGYFGLAFVISDLKSSFINCMVVDITQNTIAVYKHFGLINGGNNYFLYGYSPVDLSNLGRLGFILYTDFAVVFIYTGVLLFIAIIGCVVVTGELKFGKSKLQDLTDQQIKGLVIGRDQPCQIWAG